VSAFLFLSALSAFAFVAPAAGRGVRSVNRAITMPIPAHNAASAISWVPMSPLLSGPRSAAGAGAGTPEAAAGCATGLGVAAGMEGSSAPTLPAGVDVTCPPVTSGSDPPARPVGPSTG